MARTESVWKSNWFGKRELNRVVQELVDHIDAMVAYWDSDQICVFANAAYQHWFGRTREEMLGLSIEELLGPKMYAKNLPYLEAAYRGEKQVFEREIVTPEGKHGYMLVSYFPHLEGDRVAGIFVHVADVTPLKKLERELREANEKAEWQATHDFLTGLPNRMLLHDRLGQALAHATRSGEMVAVVSLDLDNFKQVNDRHGHALGDQYLIEIASRLSHTLRESDSVTRVGGDEFLLIFPGIKGREQIARLVTRLCDAVMAPMILEGKDFSPGCSVGVALYPLDGESPGELIVNSDRAMYSAKRSGKNRYDFFS